MTDAETRTTVNDDGAEPLESAQLPPGALRRAHELSGIGTYVIDLDRGTIRLSAEMAHLLRAGREAMTLSLEEYRQRFYPAEDREGQQAKAEQAYAGEGGLRMETRVVRADGAVVWVRASSSVERGAGGEKLVVGLMQDMTALKESEQRFRTLIEKAPIAIGVSRDGAAVYGNEKLAQLWGYERRDELVGRKVADFWAPSESEKVAEWARLQALGLPVTRELSALALRRDGSTFSARNEVVAIDLPDGPARMTFTVDVTDQLRAEGALRESERRFREIAESIDEVFWVVDGVSGRLIYVSPAYARIWGRDPHELSASPQDWLTPIHPDDRERVQQAVALKQPRGDYDETYRIVRPDGAVRWVRDRAFPLRDAAGALYRVVGTALDITEQRDLHAQLLHSQKMEAIGVLAGGVAHDFNNLLSVILSYTEMLRADLRRDDPMRGELDEIGKAAERAASLTRQLLLFSRQQVIAPKVLDLNEVLAGMDKMLRRILGEDVDMSAVCDAKLGRVRADPGNIEQVVMNLAVNARDAMPTGGKLTIETQNVELDADYASEHPGATPGPHVMLAVTDTGTGMDKETQARIFEPFFTTKEAGKGTGLGLSTVFGIARQSGGSVWVYSEPGTGTTFKVYLPRVTASLDVPGHVAAPTTLKGHETILLVEDETQVRAVAVGILKRSGYRVLVAETPGDALLTCEQHPGTIHLLLTDVVMPQMSGPELAKRLASVRSEMRVLCMSGYTDDSIVRHGVLDGGMAFLQKPFTPASLTRKVREVLDAPGKDRR